MSIIWLWAVCQFYSCGYSAFEVFVCLSRWLLTRFLAGWVVHITCDHDKSPFVISEPASNQPIVVEAEGGVSSLLFLLSDEMIRFTDIITVWSLCLGCLF